MVAMISSFSSCGMMTSRSVSGACASALIVGGGDLLRASLKYSTHLVSCSAAVVTVVGLHCLSTIGGSVAPRYLSLTILVILYTCPCSPLLAASSA